MEGKPNVAYAPGWDGFNGPVVWSITGPSTKAPRTVLGFGEITGFSPYSSRWGFLSIMQMITGGWFLGFAIAYLVELIGPFYINSWISMFFWTIGGGVVIVILTSVAYIMYYRYNQTAVDPTKLNEPTAAYFGAAHMRELFIAYIGAIIIYAFGFWIVLGWLIRFHSGTCCGTITVSPANTEDYNTYFFDISYFTNLNIIGFILCVRVFYVHMNPLATLSSLFKDMPQEQVVGGPGGAIVGGGAMLPAQANDRRGYRYYHG